MAVTKSQIKTLLESDASIDTKVTEVEEWINTSNREGFEEGHEEGYDEGREAED